MSLLLDALHRASKDKEKAALAAASAAAAGAQADGKIRLTPPPGQAAADFPPLAAPRELLVEPAVKPAEPTPLAPTPAVVEPMELELELEPNPFVAVAPVDNSRVDSPPNNSAAGPADAPAPLLTTAPVVELPPTGANPNTREAFTVNRTIPAPAPAPAPVSSAKSAAPANAQAAASAIQKAYTTPVSGQPPRRNRRVLVLGGVATCLALGLGSFLFGLWGDPERLLGLTGTSSVAIVSPPLSVPASVPEPAPAAVPSASAPALPTDLPRAATVPVDTVAAVAAAPMAAVAGPSRPASAGGVDVGASGAPTAKAPATVPTAKAPTTVPTTQAKELVMRPTSPAPVFTSKPNGQGSLEQAYSALLDGRLDDAAQAYGAALAANPMERDALLGLAYIAHSKGRRDEALMLYRKVLRLEPGNSVANAGLIALETGSNGTSNSDRAKALAARQPDSAAVQALAANALVQDGLLAEAALAFSRAQGLEPNNPWHSYNLAVALDRLGNYAQALEHYDRALLNKGRSATPLGAQQVESARFRATQLQQALEPQVESKE